MVVDRKARALLSRVFFSFAKGANTPVSLSCWLLFKYNEHKQLVEKKINPLDYNDHESFSRDYAVIKYLSKYKDLDTGIDLDKVALESWEGCEASTMRTNQALRAARLRGFSPRVEAVIFTAKRKIASLLGELGGPSPRGLKTLVSIFDSCRWGPGATYSLKGEHACLDDKIREFPISVTPGALPYMRSVLEADPHWARVILGSDVEGPFSLLPCCFTTVKGCRATLVDKSAKTKRSIAIEPTGNIFLQLGVGRFIRNRLAGVGIDLNDQTHNQHLAFLGSLSGDLATLDLASASDTVSREVVYDLLPVNWFMLMDQLRSPYIQWKKDCWTKLEKFSSMGNGFTFELESLIFWALTSATMEVLGVQAELGIFGDDIVVHRACVPLLTEVLSLTGFSVNSEKSFSEGYFRESCGKHYWNGFDVTPPYQKEPPVELQERYRLANRLYRYAIRHSESGGYTRRSWCSPSWLSALEGLCEFFFTKGRVRVRGTWRDDAARRGIPTKSVLDMVGYLAMRRAHAVPFGNESDDGLMLPVRYLNPFICSSRIDGAFKLPVYSFRPKKKTSYDVALLSYWLRFGCDEPFNGLIAVARRGQWRSRRRWFYDACYTSDPSTLDVALA